MERVDVVAQQREALNRLHDRHRPQVSVLCGGGACVGRTVAQIVGTNWGHVAFFESQRIGRQAPTTNDGRKSKMKRSCKISSREEQERLAARRRHEKRGGSAGLFQEEKASNDEESAAGGAAVEAGDRPVLTDSLLERFMDGEMVSHFYECYYKKKVQVLVLLTGHYKLYCLFRMAAAIDEPGFRKVGILEYDSSDLVVLEAPGEEEFNELFEDLKDASMERVVSFAGEDHPWQFGLERDEGGELVGWRDKEGGKQKPPGGQGRREFKEL